MKSAVCDLVHKISDKWCLEKRAPVVADPDVKDGGDPIVADPVGKDSEPPVSEPGCLSIVVLGASGDLAKKKTFPALFNLYRQVFLSASCHFKILGCLMNCLGSYNFMA